MPPTPDRRYPRARKRFGQHFLEPAWAEKLVNAIAPLPTDLIFEIGPGRGVLTRRLAAAAAHVAAIEIDRDLAAALRSESIANVTVVEADFLEFQLGASEYGDPRARSGGLRVVGNLPYNVASPILFRLVDLFEEGVPFRDATVMLQREVADRLLARPGTREYGVLTALIGLHARVERLLNLPPGAFRPAPKVQSTVVRLHFHPASPVPASIDRFRRVTNAVFSRRRKTLSNALLAYPDMTPDRARAAIATAGLEAAQRPETLDIAQFVALANAVTPAGD